MIEQAYDKFVASLQREFVNVDGVKTALYIHKTLHASPHTKTLLFIHGAGGDFHGLVPLAYELRDEFNIIFVDLPSHGASELVHRLTVAKLCKWAEELLPALEKRGVDIDTVLAYSLGCVVASRVQHKRTWYLNPPLQLSRSMKLSSAVFFRMRVIMQFGYLNYRFSVFRGRWLLRKKNTETLQLVDWLTRRTNANRSQLLEYWRVGREIAFSHRMEIPSSQFVGVLSSTYDSVVRPISAKDVAANCFVELETGHMSVIEQPRRVAKEIRRSLIML